MGTSLLWMLCVLAAAAAQDPSGLYGGGLFVPAPGAAPGQDAALQGLLQQQYASQAAGGFLVGPSGGGYQPASAPASDPRTGPLTFGPEHARPATTTPNPFRQGPLVQAAVQQQRLLQQLQQQQLAFATPQSPSARYASLPPPPAPAPASAPAGPTGFAGYGGFAPLAPSGPDAGQPDPSSYAYSR